MIRSFPLIAFLLLFGTAQPAVAADGKALYESTCIACHGASAQGAIPGVPNLARGRQLAKPDSELVANILNGFQSRGSPMAMPPKGGNPNLTAADAKAILAYMRTLTGPSALPADDVGATPSRAPATATAAAFAPAPDPAMALVPATTEEAPAAPPTESVVAPGLQQDMAAFARGAKAWGDNCARCHNMRDPKELSDRHWKVVTTHMRLRAGLDGQQVRDITAFLQASN